MSIDPFATPVSGTDATESVVKIYGNVRLDDTEPDVRSMFSVSPETDPVIDPVRGIDDN